MNVDALLKLKAKIGMRKGIRAHEQVPVIRNFVNAKIRVYDEN